MAAYGRPVLQSGDTVQVTGYYAYHGSPNRGEIPAYPDKSERVVILEKGNVAPHLEKFYDHRAALWKLVVEKRSASSRREPTPIKI